MTAKTCAGLAAICFLVSLGPAPAQTGDLRTELMHCLSFTGTVERLSCYDRLARGAASGALGAPVPAPVPPSRAAAQPPQPPARQLGQEELRSYAPAATPEQLTADITDFQKNPAGRFTVTLNNGQIWRQVAGDTTAAQYRSGQTRAVTISRGSFGSYDLRFNDRNAVFKVQRVR